MLENQKALLNCGAFFMDSFFRNESISSLSKESAIPCEPHLSTLHTASEAKGTGQMGLASIDRSLERSVQRSRSNDKRHWILTFDKVLSNTTFTTDIREMLRILRETYDYHIDIEFAANFSSDGRYKINLLQCRPLQIKEGKPIIGSIPPVERENLIMEVHGGIIGQSRMLTIDQVIYVTPSVYGHLPERDRYAIARLIGKLTHLKEERKAKTIMLLGPGRWGTSTPSLGVPVSFAEINTISVLCEIDAMHEGLVPDLSLGTHFFGDLVEMNMLYIGYSGSKKQNVLNQDLLNELPNRLTDFIPEASEWSQAVRVIDISDRGKITLIADHMKQEATVYIDTKQ